MTVNESGKECVKAMSEMLRVNTTLTLLILHCEKYIQN